jgi:hypothetical protein
MSRSSSEIVLGILCFWRVLLGFSLGEECSSASNRMFFSLPAECLLIFQILRMFVTAFSFGEYDLDKLAAL